MTYTQNQLADVCRVGAGTMTAWKKKGLIAPDVADEKGVVVLYSDEQRAIVEGLAVKIRGTITLEARAERIKKLAAATARNIIEIGLELIAAKKQCGHGNWANWLQENFAWDIREAQYLMAIAERFAENECACAFGKTVLKELLQLPAGAEQEFIDEQAAVGKPVEKQSAREVKAAVAEYNAAHGVKVSRKKKNLPPVAESIPDLSEVGVTQKILSFEREADAQTAAQVEVVPAPADDATPSPLELSEQAALSSPKLDKVMSTAREIFESCQTAEAVDCVLQIFTLAARSRRGQLATELNKQALTAAQVLK